jgi:UDP-N-acetylglucosamine--N-acetylmuramyl-(pentapeptide) pyrophosphoryl-undecaprenol N-acetylglucosamine transferase
MKALLFVTGRGVGGDAVLAINTALALTERGMDCEYVLDNNAPGYLFKKKELPFHKTSIPQAGGHAASKVTILKAGLKAIKESRSAAKLCRKVQPDIVVGIIGGGAIIGCTAARMAGIPSVGIVATPTDSKVVSQMTSTIALPESPLFHQLHKKNNYPSYMPINPDITLGSCDQALKAMPSGFDKNLPTILFSSGSTLFEKMAQAPSSIQDDLDANLMVVGDPLEEKYLKYLESVLHLGYVDNLPDLYRLADVAVLSDDGLMIHEALACQLPTVALIRVKYGRYHNMASIFPGSVVESDLEELSIKIRQMIQQKDEIKIKTDKFAREILQAPSQIADIIWAHAGN